jgi:hypothetical protein
MKRCPPGVICIENITIFVIIFIIFALIIYFNSNLNSRLNEKNNYNNTKMREIIVQQEPNFPYTNLLPPPVPGDVLLNPYNPPLRDERYLIPQINLIPPGTVPINISTNVGAVDTSYRQVGMLNPLNKQNKDNILPLMGRPVFTNRDKWQYYTIGNQFNSIKLPVIVKGRSGTNEYGVDRLYNGDTVYVEGYNNSFTATVYDNQVMQYIPFL